MNNNKNPIANRLPIRIVMEVTNDYTNLHYFTNNKINFEKQNMIIIIIITLILISVLLSIILHILIIPLSLLLLLFLFPFLQLIVDIYNLHMLFPLYTLMLSLTLACW